MAAGSSAAPGSAASGRWRGACEAARSPAAGGGDRRLARRRLVAEQEGERRFDREEAKRRGDRDAEALPPARPRARRRLPRRSPRRTRHPLRRRRAGTRRRSRSAGRRSPGETPATLRDAGTRRPHLAALGEHLGGRPEQAPALVLGDLRGRDPVAPRRQPKLDESPALRSASPCARRRKLEDGVYKYKSGGFQTVTAPRGDEDSLGTADERRQEELDQVGDELIDPIPLPGLELLHDQRGGARRSASAAPPSEGPGRRPQGIPSTSSASAASRAWR